MKLQPNVCRPEAFQLLAEQLPVIESTDGLLKAAIAISLHALDDVNPEDVDDYLLALATRVTARSQSGSVQAILAHLHQVFFVEEEFEGNQADYYNPLNSYLPAVVASRRGIPVTMAILYKVVGERAGLHIDGINAPGHFMVRVRGQRDWMIVDSFFGGTLLSREEAFCRIERVTGRRIPHTRHYLQRATNRQWISRILAGLQNLLAAGNCHEDLAAMGELRALLESQQG